jgi:hypothetical protein
MKNYISKPILFLIIFLLFSPYATIYAYRPQITTTWDDNRLYENLNYVFVPDARAVGEWEVYDFTERIANYNPNQPRWDMSNVHYRGNSVYEYGRVIQRFKNNYTVYSRWTKGFIINDWHKTVPKYEVHRISGGYYMFIEFKDDEYITNGRLKGYYVFKRKSHVPKDDDAAFHREIKQEYLTQSRIPAEERVGIINMRVPIRIMWLVYTDGVLDTRRYFMSEEYMTLVFNTMAEFKAGIEKATRNNVEIINEYTIINRQMDISSNRPAIGSSFISRELAMPDIIRYAPENKYHFVFTVSAIDTLPIRGVSNGCIWMEQGYATVHFVESETVNTSTAVHEFIHALEIDYQPGVFPEIEIPMRHALSEVFIGYEAYAEGGALNEQGNAFNNYYNMREYERAFFEANIIYTDPITNEIRYVGIFPSMWRYFNAVRN